MRRGQRAGQEQDERGLLARLGTFVLTPWTMKSQSLLCV
jgi:hypothetical protein